MHGKYEYKISVIKYKRCGAWIENHEKSTMISYYKNGGENMIKKMVRIWYKNVARTCERMTL